MKILLSLTCLMMLYSVAAQASGAPQAPAATSTHTYWLSEDLNRLAVWEARPVARDSATGQSQGGSH